MIFRAIALTAIIPGTIANAGAQTHPTDSHAATAAESPLIDPRAVALLKQNQDVMIKLRTYQAECRITRTQLNPSPDNLQPVSYTLSYLSAARPNKMRYDAWSLPQPQAPKQVDWTRPTTPPFYTFACDDKVNLHQYGDFYVDYGVAADRMHTMLEPWEGFYSTKVSNYSDVMSYAARRELLEARVIGTETVESALCDKVVIHWINSSAEPKIEEKVTWYIDRKHLVRRRIATMYIGNEGARFDALISDLKLNEPIDKMTFSYSPPPGVKLRAEAPQPPLLVKGVLAPEIQAQDVEGKTVKLSDFRGKVVVLDFWASWCGPCKASMPHSNSVIHKLQGRKLPVVLLAVDDWEDRTSYESWVKTNSQKFSSIAYVHIAQKKSVSTKMYGVSGIPTQFVIDGSGVICDAFVGYKGPTKALENAILSALK